jgi:puromycin-sensitive aminopeptidase
MCHHQNNSAHAQHEDEQPAYLLPTDVLPACVQDGATYKISLVVEPPEDGVGSQEEQSGFFGRVTIAIDVRNPVKEFPINSVGLELLTISFVDAAGVDRSPKLRHDDEMQRVWLCFDEELAKGTGTLDIAYLGSFNPSLRGLYLSWFEHEGRKLSIASTQSQPADFRSWVPSFDQPNYKFTYQFQLTVPRHLVARSNAPIVSEEDLDGSNLKVVRFGITNPLPTYLAAIAVGPFETLGSFTVGDTEVCIWSPLGQKHLTAFARKVMTDGLPRLEEFHGSKYPNPKLDLMAIPDFAFGAMENDGMFTFRSELLLIDEDHAQVQQLVRAAEVILHETDHTWDGNLVTMFNWSQLSLNELRATYMSQRISHEMFPEWDIWTRFATRRVMAQEIDGLTVTRPIVSPIHRIEECESIVDAITYSKGSAVMLQGETFLESVRPGQFKLGIQAFNQTYRFGNATTGELWDMISAVADFDFRSFMDSWMLQRGFPTVTVARVGRDSIKVTQSPFKYLGEQADSNQVWQVPLFIRAYTRGGVVETTLLLTESEQVFDLAGDFDWLVVNAGGFGFYRVQYAPDLMQEVISHLQSDLSAVERVDTLADSWALVQSGSLNLATYLGLLQSFVNDGDPTVWGIISESLDKLYDMTPISARAGFSRFVLELVMPLFIKLGWEPGPSESPQLTELRGMLLNLRGLHMTGDHKSGVYDYLYSYWHWRDGTASVQLDVLRAVVNVMAISEVGDAAAKTYEAFAEHFSKAASPQIEDIFRRSLALFPGEEQIHATLSMMLKGAIKAQDAAIVLVLMLKKNRNAREYIFPFIVDNFDQLKKRFPPILLMRALDGLSYLYREGDTDRVSEFFYMRKTDLIGFERPIAQTLEWQRINAAMFQRLAPQLTVCFATAS